MRAHRAGFIASVSLRIALFSAAVLGPLSANAADVQLNGAEGRAMAPATEEPSSPKGDTTMAAPGEAPSSSARRSSEQLEQVVVTGTRLPVKESESPQGVNIYTRQQIDQSGQTTVSDFLDRLPDVSVSLTEGAFQSMAGQTGVQLHGLPVGSTLVLIDGRRVEDSAITLANNYAANNFFDLNNIPLSAVERIEVLPEGASAIYGSDAIAGVVNLILKRDLSGFETNARYSWARDLPEWNVDLAAGHQWASGGFSLIGSFQNRGTLTGFDRAVTSTQDHTSEGFDTRDTSCATPNIYSVTGANLPGLNAPYAAVPVGFKGQPSISEFTGTAGTQNQCSLFPYASWIPSTRREALFAEGHFDIYNSLQAFAEVLASHETEDSNYYPYPAFGVPSYQQFTVSASNPFNPFGTTVGIGGLFLNAPVSYQSDAVFVRPLVGLRGMFARNWQWEITGFYSDDRETYRQANAVINTAAIQAAFSSSSPATALNPFVDAPFDSLQFDHASFQEYIQHYSGYSEEVQGFGRGTLLHLPSGELDLAVGGSYDRTKLYTDNGNYANYVIGPPGAPATYHRNSYAAFAESRIPIFGQQSSAHEPPTLEATAAVRYDHFSDFGGTTNPQYAIAWRPLSGLTLRGGYGTTFRAPPLYDLYSPVTSYQGVLVDPAHGNETVSAPVLLGGNPHLNAETGISRSLGLLYAKTDDSRLRAAVTAWHISEFGNIQHLPAQSLIDNPTLEVGAVVRNASGTIVQVNDTLLNFGEIDVAGLSYEFRYSLATMFGVWSSSLSATDTIRYRVALTPASPAVGAVSRAQDSGDWAPRWKGLATLGWARGAVSINGTVRYIGSYEDYDSTRGMGKVWYVDLNAKYTLAGEATTGATILKKAFLEIGAVNLFNRQPQVSMYQEGVVGFDPAEADLRGRVIYIRLNANF